MAAASAAGSETAKFSSNVTTNCEGEVAKGIWLLICVPSVESNWTAIGPAVSDDST